MLTSEPRRSTEEVQRCLASPETCVLGWQAARLAAPKDPRMIPVTTRLGRAILFGKMHSV